MNNTRKKALQGTEETESNVVYLGWTELFEQVRREGLDKLLKDGKEVFILSSEKRIPLKICFAKLS